MNSVYLPGQQQLLSYLASKGDLEKSPEALAYVSTITASPLAALQREPETLLEESNRIQTQLSNLAFSEYTSFLQAHESTQSIKHELETLLASLDRLDDGFKELEIKSQKMIAGSVKNTQDRETIGAIVLKQSQILELVEIPQARLLFLYSNGCS